MASAAPELLAALEKYWGYNEFRPLQAEAMQAVLNGRDSLVVLPTGGGKSLCFQTPALCRPGLAVVISPLISLMKDQVDALTDCGVPAACINSSLSVEERRRVADSIRAGELKLLYLSPERLTTERTRQFLQETQLSFVAIDEAHCISEWGHDFRPEYRMLKELKDWFPGVAVHAYTATATQQVREDIARELRLQEPEILVGSFDRPNLIYRVQRRAELINQIVDVIQRYPEDSGVIYAIRRADVEDLTRQLQQRGFQALPYHAGLSDVERQQNQEAFINDRTRIIVATVAFGMGIDKSNVRYVIHAAAPKSLENYQQESGRAGRDGLEAECWLFYSGSDLQMWRKLQSDLPPEAHAIAMSVLKGIDDYCSGTICRHRSLVQYFGQDLEGGGCKACDVCLAELELADGALILGQKILSCVVRLKENFGADYTSQVLIGSKEQRILENRHDQLPTYGLMKEHSKRSIRDWIEQLVGQEYLRKEGEYSLLRVTPEGRRLLRGEVTPRLLKVVEKKSRRKGEPEGDSWEGVDRGLFEALRVYRRKKAEEKKLPPFVIFSDKTLQALAKYRPTELGNLTHVHGIGERKSDEYGSDLIALIAEYCASADLPHDLPSSTTTTVRKVAPKTEDVPTASAGSLKAGELFAQGKSVDEVALELGRAASTTWQYLYDFLHRQQRTDPRPWGTPELLSQVAQASLTLPDNRLKTLFEALQGAVPYEHIRLALVCLKNQQGGD